MTGSMKFLKFTVIFMGITLIAGVSIISFLIFKKESVTNDCVNEDFEISGIDDFMNFSSYNKNGVIITKDKILILDICHNKVVKNIKRIDNTRTNINSIKTVPDSKHSPWE